jgi:uncharacterized RDD family membrane protein YckC
MQPTLPNQGTTHTASETLPTPGDAPQAETPLPGERILQPAAPFRRFVAFVLDGFFVFFLIALALPWFGNPNHPFQEGSILWLSYLLYHGAFESSSLRATPGKWLLGLRVCGPDRRRLSFVRACARKVSSLIYVHPFLFYHSLYRLMTRKQIMSDRLAKSYVYQRHAPSTTLPQHVPLPEETKQLLSHTEPQP